MPCVEIAGTTWSLVFDGDKVTLIQGNPAKTRIKVHGLPPSFDRIGGSASRGEVLAALDGTGEDDACRVVDLPLKVKGLLHMERCGQRFESRFCLCGARDEIFVQLEDLSGNLHRPPELVIRDSQECEIRRLPMEFG